MDPVSSLPALAALLVAIATTYLLARRFGPPPDQGRFASIDGLRGYLAFSVFLHHSSVWYFYLRDGVWRVPPSNLYTHLGQSSVALFFMITGFLFFSKLIDGRTGSIDWGRLFISRFLRLVPLYVFAMLLLFSITALLSNGTLRQPLALLVSQAARWLGFTILGAPDLNGVENTFTIVAGATWSLPYEWFFYFSLPLLALAVRATPPRSYLIVSIVGTVWLLRWHPALYNVLPFLGGITASLLVRIEAFRRIARKTATSFLTLGSIVLAVAIFPTAYSIGSLLLLSLAFALIAGGNSIFKILTSPVSRTLGEMAYSVYLLHGLTLFVLFTFVIGTDNAKTLSPVEHWSLVIGISPLLILASYCTFCFIERPSIQSTNALTTWLRSRPFLRFKHT